MHTTTPRYRLTHRGFTHADVLVSVVVAAIVAATLVLVLQRARGNARRQTCEFRMVNLAQAVLQYEQIHERFPGYRNRESDADGDQRETGWIHPVLPYLFENTSASPTIASQRESQARFQGLCLEPATPTHIKEIICPSDRARDVPDQRGRTSFVGNTGMPDANVTSDLPPDWPANGIFLNRSPSLGSDLPYVSLSYVDDHDGSAKTLLLAENVDAGSWVDMEEARVGFVWVANLVGGRPDPDGQVWPINARIGDGDGTIPFARPSSYHPGGVNVAFCDGSTQFLSQDVDYLVFTEFMTPDGHAARVPGSRAWVDAPFRSPAP